MNKKGTSMWRTVLALGVSALFLSGCASHPKPELSDLPDVDDHVELEVVWRRQVGDGADGDYLRLAPAVTDDAVFAVDAAGLLMKVDRANGKVLWKEKTQLALNGGVAADDEHVVIASTDGDVQVRDTESGELIWSVNVGREILSAPALSYGAVFIQTSDGRLYALDRKDGEQKWLFNAAVPVLTLRGSASPKLSGPSVVAGFASGRIAVIRQEDGQVYYERPVALPEGRSDLERMVDIDGDIWVEDQLAVLTSYQGELMVLQLANGKVIWSQPFSSTVGAVSGDGTVVAVDTDSHILGFSQYYQSEQWSNGSLIGRYLGSPAWLDGNVIVGDFGGYLHVLDGNSGELVGRKRVDWDPVTSRPIVVDSDIIVQSNDGKIVLLRVKA